jgi:hypothetical protein
MADSGMDMQGPVGTDLWAEAIAVAPSQDAVAAEAREA